MSKPRVPDDHPAIEALRRAPVVPGEPSAEEREALAAGASGPFIPHEVVMAELRRRAADAENCPACIQAEQAGGGVADCPVHAPVARDESDRDLVARLRLKAPTTPANALISLPLIQVEYDSATKRIHARIQHPETIASLDAPPELQELFAELDRRDPKMRAGG